MAIFLNSILGASVQKSCIFWKPRIFPFQGISPKQIRHLPKESSLANFHQEKHQRGSTNHRQGGERKMIPNKCNTKEPLPPKIHTQNKIWLLAFSGFECPQRKVHCVRCTTLCWQEGSLSVLHHCILRPPQRGSLPLFRKMERVGNDSSKGRMHSYMLVQTLPFVLPVSTAKWLHLQHIFWLTAQNHEI